MTDFDESFRAPLSIPPALDGYSSPVHTLQAILDGPRVGEVEGVQFDFRHERLPSSETWHAPRGSELFGVVYPWDRDPCGGDADVAPQEAETNFIFDGGSVGTNVYPGDRMSVDRLERFYRGGGRPPYLDPHDAFSLWAYLVVTRPDGKAFQIEEPISFNARDAMGPASPHLFAGDDGLDDFVGDFRVSLDKASRRLERLRVADGERRPGVEWVDLAFEVSEAFEPHGSPFYGGAFPKSPDDLAYLLDMAVTFGYAVAMAERAPLVDAAEKRTRPATMARRSVTDPVRQAAKADILANPKTTQTACARRLAMELGRDQRSIEKLIAPMFRWATLPGGGREKRAHRWLTNPRQIDGWPGLSSV
ncbi:MAG: hypothetical protein KKA16_00245 [Alphaproteobacteria bacterium]|nr:hypothetical protein [Alphaproteobacteria bacterium]MBU2379397.1 hypothetical protein [Alphaproteobacteria bacterium]